MKALVIYDNTGRIYSIYYGEENTPQGLQCMYVDIVAGAQLEYIDVTDPENPQPVFSYLPETDIGFLRNQVTSLTENVTQLQTETDEIKETLNPTINTDTCTLEELQKYTVKQFGKSCSSIIYAGSDVETEKGIKHFSYKEEDQTNLSSAVNLAIMTGLDIPYHADGEDCCLWCSADIVNIYGVNELLKTYQTTYCNLMNGLIRNSQDKETILSMSYGDPLPDDKQIDLDAAMQQSQKVFQTFINSLKVPS